MKPHVLISLTSIPRRLDGSLPEILAGLKRQRLKSQILVNIPTHYRKWGAVEIPQALREIEDVIVFSPSKDYGPGTKLLGALEYIQQHPEITHVITVDDDMVIDDDRYLEHLAAHARALPNYAVTFGGIKLDRYPFKYLDGLSYDHHHRFVDGVAGFRGVLYPVHLMRGSQLPFTFFENLPAGAVNDDDAYFGIVLSVMKIPLLAIPIRAGGEAVKVSELEGGSGVEEQVDKGRTQNEMEIFQHAVKAGYFSFSRGNATRQLTPMERLALFLIRLRNKLRRVMEGQH